jgi:hypothetical protein
MFTCPHHPNVQQRTPGTCSVCGTTLTQVSTKAQDATVSTVRPLVTIIGLIALASTLGALEQGVFILQYAMGNFMAGFFWVFAGFKLLDVPGFKTGFAKYDILAKRVPQYGSMYPYIELALAIGYTLSPMNRLLNIITIILMTFGGIGVSLKLLKRERITCACLGTKLGVPLTYITALENFGMAIMAVAMLS